MHSREMIKISRLFFTRRRRRSFHARRVSHAHAARSFLSRGEAAHPNPTWEKGSVFTPKPQFGVVKMFGIFHFITFLASKVVKLIDQEQTKSNFLSKYFYFEQIQQ